MSKLTKNQKAMLAKVEPGKLYKLSEAAALLKEITFTKFNASVDVDVRLGVDPRKANQMVRGFTLKIVMRNASILTTMLPQEHSLILL